MLICPYILVNSNIFNRFLVFVFCAVRGCFWYLSVSTFTLTAAEGSILWPSQFGIWGFFCYGDWGPFSNGELGPPRFLSLISDGCLGSLPNRLKVGPLRVGKKVIPGLGHFLIDELMKWGNSLSARIRTLQSFQNGNPSGLAEIGPVRIGTNPSWQQWEHSGLLKLGHFRTVEISTVTDSEPSGLLKVGPSRVGNNGTIPSWWNWVTSRLVKWGLFRIGTLPVC